MARKKISDQFTEKDISRQRKCQLRKLTQGLCIRCGKSRPKEASRLCSACHEKEKTMLRNRYRLRVGIPLDAPLYTRA